MKKGGNGWHAESTPDPHARHDAVRLRSNRGGDQVKRTFKYRLYPTPAQAVVLDRWLWLCRRLYNACLEQRIAAYQMQRKSLSAFTQQRI